MLTGLCLTKRNHRENAAEWKNEGVRKAYIFISIKSSDILYNSCIKLNVCSNSFDCEYLIYVGRDGDSVKADRQTEILIVGRFTVGGILEQSTVLNVPVGRLPKPVW